MWRWFGELDAARTGNGYSANAISFTEIDAWARLSGVVIAPWELQALRAMDGCVLGILASGSQTTAAVAVSERPLSTDLFDALFP